MNIGTYVQFKHARINTGPLSGKIIGSYEYNNQLYYVIDISAYGPQMSYEVKGIDDMSISKVIAHPDNLIELAKLI